jgi:gamma-glutamyl phosphate reductase
MASSTANGHSNSPSELEHLARSAKSASFLLASAPLSSKSAALKAIYEQLKRDEAVIRSANEGDLEVGMGVEGGGGGSF